MHEPSPAQRHPLLLKLLAVTVALGFLGTVMCTAGGSGSGVPQPVAARTSAQDGGSVDAGEKASSALEGGPPEAEERFFPATKSMPLPLPREELPSPRQAAPQQEAPTQQVPK
jgi:hypothetical protein